MAKRVNYLNNKDLLKQIHLSKKSFCSYNDPATDHQFDLILHDINEVNDETVDEAKVARATRINKETDQSLSPEDIDIHDLVFRIMTNEHVPLGPKKRSKAASKVKKKKVIDNVDDLDIDISDLDNEASEPDTVDQDIELAPIRCNFPPFKHYRIAEKTDVEKTWDLLKNSNGFKLRVVGISHWKGDLETGKFSKTHGSVTNELAKMYMKLCERYGTRSNWRGYCVDEETEALTQRGWLNESEITTNDVILSYNGENMIWSSIRSIFSDDFSGKMFKMTSRSIDALMTPGHKIVTDKGLVKIEHLLESDRIVVMGNAAKHYDTKIHSDEFVELLGWITTEGNYQPKKKIVTIYQNEGEYADRVRTCLTSLGYEYTEKKSSKSPNIAFAIKRKHWDDIVSVMPDKNLTMSFILSLSEDQRGLLINTMIDGDGHRDGLLMRYTQKDKEHIDVFQALCALHGLKTNTHFVENKMSYGKPTSYYAMNIFSKRGNKTRGACVDLHGGKNSGRSFIGKGKQFHPNFPTVNYKGKVWCPETDYGCFLARRNGKVYLTGNTYNDEMRSQALLQLCQIGLQFDESKSQNPFAYYTAAVTNAFTRVLNIEKRVQNIRDDILEANGLNPSWTRQLENDNVDKKYLDQEQNKKSKS